MRVIAGEKGGRRLLAPPGRETRPTADRVREAAFSILESHVALEGLVVWDLFAGSGALGIEAISRGAAHATFVDHARTAVSAIRANLARLGYDASRSMVTCAEVLRWVHGLGPAPHERASPFSAPDVFAPDRLGGRTPDTPDAPGRRAPGGLDGPTLDTPGRLAPDTPGRLAPDTPGRLAPGGLGGLDDAALVGPRPARAATVRAPVPPEHVDIVLADPPYTWRFWPALLEGLEPYSPWVVMETEDEPELLPSWLVIRSKRYGGTLVTLARLRDGGAQPWGDDAETARDAVPGADAGPPDQGTGG